MKVPTEITYRYVEKTDAIDTLVREKIEKLEQFCNYMSSCRVAIEKAHDHPKTGSPYRVRIDITVPPNHELAVVKNPDEGIQYQELQPVIRSAFDAARRQLIELVEQQQDRTKTHVEQETHGIITKLFKEDGYGFFRTTDTGREIYFHKNSVLHSDFDRLELGTGVHFTEEQGQMGPQASSLQIIDKPGVQSPKSEEREIQPPLGWK
ncbi:MAG: HPF/RaiA family ribosome-associated protein [Halothece sp.]